MSSKEYQPTRMRLKEHHINSKPDRRKVCYTETKEPEEIEEKLEQEPVQKPQYYKYFKTGSSYYGEWNSIDMNGFGRYTFPHGVIYEGGMKNGEFHGEGILTYPRGQSIRGVFENGEMLSWEFSFGQDWVCSLKNYCQFPDRRYLSTLGKGFLPPGEERVTQRQPERTIPEGHYDVEDGFYDPKTKWIYSAESLKNNKEPVLIRMALNSVKPIDTKIYLPDGSTFMKKMPFVPVYQDENFIAKSCRKAWDEPTGYRPDLYEKWMSGIAAEAERYRRKFITKDTVEDSDSNCLKMLDFFSKIAAERRKKADI